MARTTARLAPAGRLPYASWAALVLLLLAELIALSVRFDAAAVPADAAWPVGLVGRASMLLRPAIVAALVTSLLGGRALHTTLLRLSGAIRRRWSWPPLLGHFGSLAALTRLSAALFDGHAGAASASTIAALWSLCAGLTLLFWGDALVPIRLWPSLIRAAGRPLLLGVGAGCLSLAAGASTTALWRSFHRSTFLAVRALLGAFHGDLVCDPANFVLGAGGFSVRIAPQCSGYEGIGLIWVFLGAYLVLFRRELRFPSALLLLPLGTVVIWLANVLRIGLLVAIGASGYAGVAVGGFHSQSGWLAFNAVGLGLVLASRRSRIFRRRSAATDEAATWNPATTYLMPLLVLVATTMVCGAFSAGGFDGTYPARMAATGAVLWWYRRRYDDLARAWSWTALAIGVVVFAIWMALEPASTRAGGPTPIPRALAAMPWLAALGWIASRAFGSVVVVPIAEELAFRGYLARRMVSPDFEAVPGGRMTWTSILLSSLLFGALHQRWFAGTLAGLFYAGAYARRGKLSEAILAHATTNALIALQAIGFGA